MKDGRLLTCNKNSDGDKSDPCGTPELIGCKEEVKTLKINDRNGMFLRLFEMQFVMLRFTALMCGYTDIPTTVVLILCGPIITCVVVIFQ